MDDLTTVANSVYSALLALAVTIPRPLAMFTILPIMTRLGLPQLMQLAIIIVICLPIVTPLTTQIQPQLPLSAGYIGMLCAKEAFIGLVMGLVVGIPFWAMEMAGNIVDFVREAPDAEVQDPQGTTEASITGNLFSIFITLYFIALGGLTMLVDIIYSSYEVWPVLSEWPAFNDKGALKIFELADTLMRTALLIAGPLIIFMLIAFLLLMIISRFVPQTNVFDLSMSFRNIAFLLAIQVYVIYIATYVSLQSDYIKGILDKVKGMLSG